ncbi:transcription factor IIIA-like [Chironomus tepperi]|uniref:transcription factor IIIA-like n=1 Tax=Chironomus tepperi TaxID=113505 RepID=UPI00391F4849
MNEEDNKNKGKYSCTICGLSFRRKDRLDRHFFFHTGIKEFKCEYEDCEKSFTNLSHLKRHTKNCHLNKPQISSYVCEYSDCLQGFTNFSNLNRHYKKSHLNVVEYKCDQCFITCRRKDQLRRHMKNNHNVGNYTYSCEKCGNGYFNMYSYLKHIKVHDIKECSDCHKHFDKWSQLVIHRKEEHKINKSNDKFECDICGKIFCRKPNIREHMKIHLAKEYVYSCTYENCSKFYSAKRNLTAHIRSKHEGKNFLCYICKISFSSNQRLQKHIAAHESNNSATLKKSNIAFLLGMKLHSTIQSEFYKNVPSNKIIDGISTESEFSDN